eukprot:scaffold18195_cov33-Phaeocystis_antarctica.AAC.1
MLYSGAARRRPGEQGQQAAAWAIWGARQMCERALLRVSCPARWAAACCCRHMRCGVVGQWWLCFLAASKQLAAGLWTSATGSAWGVARGAGRS